jgi:4-amino-4-deoxy-L-arabinose transferase-like glycosyltransferase
MKKSLLWTAIGASFLWMAFVYASFYLVPEQRPLETNHLHAIGGTLLNLLAAACLLFVAAGAGWRVCRWLGIAFASPIEQIVLGTGAGLGLLSLLVLALGLAGGLSRWAMALLVGVLGLGTLPDGIAVWQSLRSQRPGNRPAWPLALYLGITFLLTLTLALAPPTDWDGLFYHLTMPRHYIEQARIAPITEIPHQFFPGLVEMLYTAALLIRGDVTAKLLHYGYMLLLAGMVYLVAEQQIGQAHAWPAVALYAAIPMVAVLGGWAYTDLALAFYQLAALYALLRWIQERRPRSIQERSPRWTQERRPRWTQDQGHRRPQGQMLSWIALSGLFCGLAMGVKYTSFLCPLYLLLVLGIASIRDQAPRPQALRAIGALAGVSLWVAAPWYARNLAWTGNPVYPFAYRWLGASPSMAWDTWRAAWYARAGSGLGWDLAAWLKLPWTVTLGLRDMNFYDGRIGPLFLLALPFTIAWGLRLFGRPGPRPRALVILIGFGLVQYLAWMAGAIGSRSLFQSRLLLSACVALCGPIVYVYDELRALDRPRFSLQNLIGMSVALVLAANVCTQSYQVLRRRPLPVLVGLESRRDYLERNLGAHYAAMELLNDRVSQEGRVLLLWEPRSYYSHVPTEPDPILDRWPWLVSRHDGDLDAIAAELRAQGYTHVLYHRAGAELVRRANLDPLREADWNALNRFLELHLDPEAQAGDAYVLYVLP